MLSANSLQNDAASALDLGVMLDSPSSAQVSLGTSNSVPATETYQVSSPPPPRNNSQSLASGALLATAPFPLEQTFLLHSLPGATKTIYLDFDGFVTRETAWNTSLNLPNILTPAYDLDGDFLTFSEEERLVIQSVWERVSEDFRPFNVNVTTEDPGIEALRNTGGTDDAWGQRAVIGGDSTNDWFTPADGRVVGGVSYGSFAWDSDTPNFTFGGDYGPAAAAIASTVSHETGHALGLAHDGQFRFYKDIAEDPPEIVRLYDEYYDGHGSGATSWGAIMGSGSANVEQWSKGEYFNATNDEAGTSPQQDDLEVITNRGGNNQNGFGYRTDDHGGTIATASAVIQDPATTNSDVSLFEGEGIIERNTDIDFFSFTVEGLGEIVTLNIQPFYNGPNLDILAKIIDSNGVVVATGNSIDELGATFADLTLLPGTYFVSIQGDGRPLTFVDPAFHPGPFEAEGNPPDPELPPDTSDWGYTNYGSLGYYSIVGTRYKSLVVGVDFDEVGGLTPDNWNQYTGGGTQVTLSDLVSETGDDVPYELTISTTGANFTGVASADPLANLPIHTPALDEVGGYFAAEDETWTFTWSNLAPKTVYQVYVFGHSNEHVKNDVTVIGGEWNGVQQIFNFTQDISAGDLAINDADSANQDLSSFSLLVISNEAGEIVIQVTSEEGFEAGIAGIAIAPTKVGTIEGQKWNDVNGNQTKDASEQGLPGWVVYLDLNNDGILNSTNDKSVVAEAGDLPQALPDYATKKSELLFTEVGQIVDIDVTIELLHTYDADMNVTLISPSGTRVILFADIGGSGDHFQITTLDDEATTAITAGAAPFNGTFNPQEFLSAFDGEDAAGIWQIEIEDDAQNDTGLLLAWSISVKLAGVFLEPYAVTDANGEYAFTDLPAGQYFVREHFSQDQIDAGWRQTWSPPPVTVRSGAEIKDIDFGNWIPVSQHGSIHGQKFNDLDGDGEKDAAEPGLSGWIVYLDANGNGVRDIASTPDSLSGPSKPIIDFATSSSQVTVTGVGTVFNVEVTVDITHSFMGDLDAFLVSPSGRQVELFTGVGGQYNNFNNLSLSDDATRSIATIGIDDQPYSGTWRPEGLLSDFIGEDAAGIWTLVVRDNSFADQGTLNSWTLKVSVGELFRVTDASGNYAIDGVVPGQYIIREEQKPGWVQIPPADTAIPAANWAGSQWTVVVEGVDNPGDPDGADSHRNVKNVSFGNKAQVALAGDFDLSGHVDGSDYNLWRRTLGSSVLPFSGADGDGDGVVDADDYAVWRSHFGNSLPGSGSVTSSSSVALAASGSSTGNALPTTALPLTSVTTVPSPEPSLAGLVLNISDFSFETADGGVAANTSAGATSSTAASQSDSALLAWATALASEGAATAYDENVSDAADVESGDEFCDTIDSIFDELGAAALAAGCAV